VWLDSAEGLHGLEQRQAVSRDSQSVNTIPVWVRGRISGEMVDAVPVLKWRCGCDECFFDSALTDG
jgi:hypothetical protein